MLTQYRVANQFIHLFKCQYWFYATLGFQLKSILLPPLRYHPCQKSVYQVFSYITLFHYPGTGSLRGEDCLHIVCHALAWQVYSTTGSPPWHCFFCLFAELPFYHEALPCTVTATATSNHILFIKLLQPRSAELYLDITMNSALFHAAITCLGLFLRLLKVTHHNWKCFFILRLLCLALFPCCAQFAWWLGRSLFSLLYLL